jgi:hypothetical protein
MELHLFGYTLSIVKSTQELMYRSPKFEHTPTREDYTVCDGKNTSAYTLVLSRSEDYKPCEREECNVSIPTSHKEQRFCTKHSANSRKRRQQLN